MIDPTQAAIALGMPYGECGLEAIEAAAVTRAVERYPLRPERYPLRPGETGQSIRYICAGALVWALCGAGGFRYGGRPPLLPLGAGPIDPDPDAELAHAGACLAARAAGREPPEPRGRYEVAEAICCAALGRSAADDDAPGHPTPARLQRAVVLLAIDLLCDESRGVAEIAAGAAGWVCRFVGSEAGPHHRAARMLAAAGYRWQPVWVRAGAEAEA